MSNSKSNSPSAGTFGVPDSHFLHLAVDLLRGLALQSRERGHEKLAALVEIAKAEAEGSLRIDAKELQQSPEETKLVRIVKAIRSQITTQIDAPAPVAPEAAVSPKAKVSSG